MQWFSCEPVWHFIISANLQIIHYNAANIMLPIMVYSKTCKDFLVPEQCGLFFLFNRMNTKICDLYECVAFNNDTCIKATNTEFRGPRPHGSVSLILSCVIRNVASCFFQVWIEWIHVRLADRFVYIAKDPKPMKSQLGGHAPTHRLNRNLNLIFYFARSGKSSASA